MMIMAVLARHRPAPAAHRDDALRREARRRRGRAPRPRQPRRRARAISTPRSKAITDAIAQQEPDDRAPRPPRVRRAGRPRPRATRCRCCATALAEVPRAPTTRAKASWPSSRSVTPAGPGSRCPMPNMRELVAELEARRAKVREMGGADKIARQHARGKMTARERLAAFFDDGVVLRDRRARHADGPRRRARRDRQAARRRRRHGVRQGRRPHGVRAPPTTSR